MDKELAESLKELLVTIDEFRLIDDNGVMNQLNFGDLIYSSDFVDNYEAIRRYLIEAGELPRPPYDTLFKSEE